MSWARRLVFLLVLINGSSGSFASSRLDFPAFSPTGYYWLASRIYHSEALGQQRYLTHWNAGEDFPSLGIGHFIWFPAGVDAPFDESFPAMVRHVRASAGQCAPVPAWLDDLDKFEAPWPSKLAFDAAQQSPEMQALRAWLSKTAVYQARYIVENFARRWNALAVREKDSLTVILQGLLQTSRGAYAVIDYSNFKGMGTNPRERYLGEGWGLVQVLQDMRASAVSDENLVTAFSHATAERLKQRVRNAPPERNEARWLDGWLQRVQGYTGPVPELSEDEHASFRVKPYVQLTGGQARLIWFSNQPEKGRVRLSPSDPAARNPIIYESRPVIACELAYHLTEISQLTAAQGTPYRHEVVIAGLFPGQRADYEVEQGRAVATGRIYVPAKNDDLRLMVYGDSETEPESRGKPAHWSIPGRVPSSDTARYYPVDQSEGYAANIAIMRARQPHAIAIAGDLVQSGGEQRDWDEFWRHNATLAASVPLFAAAGNHDYYGGPGDLGGYSNAATARAIDKFKSYFGQQTYYSLDVGPVRLIVLDTNNGVPEQSLEDTNWYLSGNVQGGVAPDWHPGSRQWQWLEGELEAAQQSAQFTFVVFHIAPYSSGIHGLPPGLDEEHNFSSGMPLQRLTRLFLRFGVDAVFNGHDEMYEHSVVAGVTQLPDGSEQRHSIHFFTIGTGGDGLRGPDSLANNPSSVFLAHRDAPEVWADGMLKEGGKHYGHMEINIKRLSHGQWQARFEPVYVFPVTNQKGEVESFERRVYDDVVTLENTP